MTTALKYADLKLMQYPDHRRYTIPVKLKTREIILNPQLLDHLSGRQYICQVLKIDSLDFKAIAESLGNHILSQLNKHHNESNPRKHRKDGNPGP